jgi:hypothetical protein
MPLAHVSNYGNSATAYLGFGLSTAFLAGMTAGPPSPSNLPRAPLAKYGAFHGTASGTTLSAFPVLWGLSRGMVAYNLIAQLTIGQNQWPYGNGIT